MSIESCTQFLRTVYSSRELTAQLRAMTAAREMVALGRRHGFDFQLTDLAAASSAFVPPEGEAPGPPPAPEPAAADPGRTSFYHHEYSLTDLPGFEPVLSEIPRLAIKPPTVDLDAFARRHRSDDLRTTDLAPGSPEYRAWEAGVQRAAEAEGRPGPPDSNEREFHVINLDEHVDHPGYLDYLAAKGRTIAALEDLFGCEIRFSGSMWYPPNSYRLWHTNESQPGWRMYIIEVDPPFASAETSFFRYMHPDTGELVTLTERPKIVRFFKVEQDPDRLFWHCIVNPTASDRWSFGFVVPDGWQRRLGLDG
ncbi:Nif11-like leader peptide family natural product precursor [Streptomonospora sp. S1-112]|uniref:Nif11-like leader peptide family natural product n=1 Tax=Streptomonospora mangrovi TaxID=2883123 RepID=A0A9X3SJ30_9ACTN|nr:Nif11-like leader peptide family natural product precursor [Streptomonospora mangrovi]MDA0566909.1 Nif11-like leader peptide family natural product precursor [Streptomonospora mangrovi]